MYSLDTFNKDKYIYVKNFLNHNDCDRLTNHLKNLISEGKTNSDPQCPKSQSVHGDPELDALLEKAIPLMEEIVGKKLLPTYSYARIYFPGENLHNHRDRESCEYSATLTLGFEGNIWPICFSENENKTNSNNIIINKGDLVVYKGMELWHWRNKYVEGNWQAQVFLHYVDANGKYSEYKYDKREKLSNHSFIETEKLNDHNSKDTEKLIRIYPNLFSDEACNTIIKNYSKDNIERIQPWIGTEENKKIDLNVRNVERVIIPSYRDLGARLTAVGLDVNHNIYKFNITHCNQAEFLIYPPEGKYTSHIDTFIDPEANECRKITVLAFLNDDFEGGQFYISNGENKIYPPQKKGNVIAFPSFLVHGVEDIKSGIRYSAVAWMCGPWFK